MCKGFQLHPFVMENEKPLGVAGAGVAGIGEMHHCEVLLKWGPF